MQMMNKKFLSFCLCVFLGFSLSACSSPGLQGTSDGNSEVQNTAGDSSDIPDTQETTADSSNTPETQETAVDSENNSQDGQEGLDMTDEELLEALGDNIHVVSNDDYFEMVAEFKEKTDDYMGQIYQLEGVFSKDGDDPYLVRTDGDVDADGSLPLKYVTDEPEEGTAVRITGIVNFGEVGGETVAVLDVAVIQTLD